MAFVSVLSFCRRGKAQGSVPTPQVTISRYKNGASVFGVSRMAREISSGSHRAAFEIDTESKRIRIKVSDDAGQKLSRTGYSSLNPYVAKLILGEERTKKINLELADDGWLYGFYKNINIGPSIPIEGNE